MADFRSSVQGEAWHNLIVFTQFPVVSSSEISCFISLTCYFHLFAGKLGDRCDRPSDCKRVIGNSDCVSGVCACMKGHDPQEDNSLCVPSKCCMCVFFYVKSVLGQVCFGSSLCVNKCVCVKTECVSWCVDMKSECAHKIISIGVTPYSHPPFLSIIPTPNKVNPNKWRDPWSHESLCSEFSEIYELHLFSSLCSV